MAKISEHILTAVGKFLGRVVIVKRAYQENLQGRGFHTQRFYSAMETFVVLGNDPVENKKKISQTERKLMAECQRQVTKDRDKEKEIRKEKKE